MLPILWSVVGFLPAVSKYVCHISLGKVVSHISIWETDVEPHKHELKQIKEAGHGVRKNIGWYLNSFCSVFGDSQYYWALEIVYMECLQAR